MLDKFQKIIASIIILSLVLSIGFNAFIFKPKQAQALDGGGSWATAIKELVLDTITYVISDLVLNNLSKKIQDWGLGKTTDENEPFFVEDWSEFFQKAINLGSAKFIAEFGLTKLCGNLNVVLGEQLGIGTYSSDLPTYSTFAACTLDTVVDNVESFLENPSISVYGWSSWDQLLKMQNNVVGAYLLAAEEKQAKEEAEKEAKDKETAVSAGTKNQTTTAQSDTDACKKRCSEAGPPSPDCVANCDNTTQGLALDTTIKNWGSQINKAMEDSMGKDMARMIGADEISKLIGIFFSAVLNKAITGLGMAFKSDSATTQEKDRASNLEEYAYAARAPLNGTDAYKFKANILNGILKAMQQLSTAIMNCDDTDSMMKYKDYTKNVADVMSSNLEGLYAGLSGINLKPDFTVLDSVMAPYPVYGYRWGEIPYTKFPYKCSEITNQLNLGDQATCQSIVSGLEPNYDSPNFRCTQCLYDDSYVNCPPNPLPPFDNYPSQTIFDQKQAFLTECVNRRVPVQLMCGDCIKKADEKCGQTDAKQKNDCINALCTSEMYKDLQVVTTIKDGVDFYNKCLIEEKKNACYTCLKEYFMPVDYCYMVGDYVKRAIIKYPAVTYFQGQNNYTYYWIGPYNGTVASAKGCAGNDAAKDIDLDLICRITPDFGYTEPEDCYFDLILLIYVCEGGDEYAGVCQKECTKNNITEKELNDIVDDRPTASDCGNKKVAVGGRNPGIVIGDGQLITLGKCCAAFADNDDKYAACLGTKEEKKCTWAKPVKEEPWCYCDEGDRPLAFTRDGFPRSSGLGGDCGDATFNASDATDSTVYGYTNAAPWDKDIVYFSTAGCSEASESWDNTSGLGLVDGAAADCTQCCTTDSSAPSSTISGCSWNASTGHKECDLGTTTGTIHTGVYHTTSSTCGTSLSTGWHVCTECPDDCDGAAGEAGCPYYGTQYDQCTGKVK